MKQCLFCLMLLAVVALSYIGTPVAVAQVPPGVVVDSIAPANDWTNDWIPRHHSYTADPKTGRLAFVTGTGTGTMPGGHCGTVVPGVVGVPGLYVSGR